MSLIRAAYRSVGNLPGALPLKEPLVAYRSEWRRVEPCESFPTQQLPTSKVLEKGGPYEACLSLGWNVDSLHLVWLIYIVDFIVFARSRWFLPFKGSNLDTFS